MSNEVVRVVVPSFKRPTRVLTKDTVKNVTIVCPDRQVKDYQKGNPGIEIIGHPDSLYGINQARQWIYDYFGNVMMLDDDINGVDRMLIPPVYSQVDFQNEYIPDKGLLTPEEAYEVIQHTADMARQMGAYLFGFTSAVNRRDVRPQVPFSINSYVKGTTMGMLKGSKLHFPMEDAGRICEDHYVTLLNAYYHRYCIVDNRYSFRHTGTFKTTGGCSEYRTSDAEEISYKFLRSKFGKAVQLKPTAVTNQGKARKKSHEWERVIAIPY